MPVCISERWCTIYWGKIQWGKLVSLCVRMSRSLSVFLCMYDYNNCIVLGTRAFPFDTHIYFYFATLISLNKQRIIIVDDILRLLCIQLFFFLCLCVCFFHLLLLLLMVLGHIVIISFDALLLNVIQTK